MTTSNTVGPGLWGRLAHEVRRRSLRSIKRLIRPLWMRRLDARMRDASAPLLDPNGPVVSLTTYGARWHSVHYTIESIGAGSLRPSRLTLWVGAKLVAAGLPEALERQVARGLEVHACEDVGPHTKYHPFILESDGTRDLVTADDDVLYPRHWLADLVAAARRRPGLIHGFRAHRMVFESDGRFRPYRDWPACRSTEPSALNFITGVAGALYPPAMQHALREAGDGFRACCPRADDIWLNAVAWRAGIAVCQTVVFSPLLFELPGTRTQGLARENVQSGGNDRQLEMTYTAQERAQLHALSVQSINEGRQA